MSNIGPKAKVSKQRRNTRKANWKIATPTIVECPQCHENKQPHTVCPNCGYYDGEKKIVVSKDKENKND